MIPLVVVPDPEAEVEDICLLPEALHLSDCQDACKSTLYGM